MPRFETVRSNAYKLLGDAQDWLHSDVDDPPRGDRAEALRRARQHIAAAKEALNEAAQGSP
ncbi:hypothetical protein Drose_05575 [Dactylosporangium roseum]|uniref:Uncharacterized protein n=1 Tax=Dactylosporangium roseum TaxID=47989 RepID=A0ABY5ZBN1_9ACTN|nr:hypothetical protein [Dactylosporangium roseum]UWZ37739.1 hypothetical protein Drose_05575 [Dactylosporangium roseum]